MFGAFKGAFLGMLNACVIALGIAGIEGQSNIAVLVLFFGGLSGVVAGILLGTFAFVIDDAPVPLRIGVLTVPAVGVVFGLAHEFRMLDLAMVSCIPTVVSALILERWTRRVQAPPVPVARANQV